MVASQKEEVLRVLNFVAEKKNNGLDGLLSPVYVISQKKIVFLRRETTIVKYLEQVLKLTVDITHYFDRGLQFQEHGLSQKYLANGLAHVSDFGLGHFHVMSFFLGG